MNAERRKGIYFAEDFKSRFWGLMGKKRWPDAYGGIYFPRCRLVHTFFTFLKPDLVFVDKNQKILKIFPSASPWRIFWGSWDGRHCLELPEGAAGQWGLEEGDVLDCDKA